LGKHDVKKQGNALEGDEKEVLSSDLLYERREKKKLQAGIGEHEKGLGKKKRPGRKEM